MDAADRDHAHPGAHFAPVAPPRPGAGDVRQCARPPRRASPAARAGLGQRAGRAPIRAPSITLWRRWWPPRRPWYAPRRRFRRRGGPRTGSSGRARWRRKRAGRDRARAAADRARMGRGLGRRAARTRCSACAPRPGSWCRRAGRRGGRARCSIRADGGAGRLLIDTDAPSGGAFRQGAGGVGRHRDLRRLRGRSAGHGRAGAGGPGRRSRAGRADRAGPAARPPRPRPAGAPGRAVAGRDRLEAVDDPRSGACRRAAARGSRRRRQRRLARLAQGLRGVAWPRARADRRCTRSSMRCAPPPVESSGRGRSAAPRAWRGPPLAGGHGDGRTPAGARGRRLASWLAALRAALEGCGTLAQLAGRCSRSPGRHGASPRSAGGRGSKLRRRADDLRGVRRLGRRRPRGRHVPAGGASPTRPWSSRRSSARCCGPSPASCCRRRTRSDSARCHRPSRCSATRSPAARRAHLGRAPRRRAARLRAGPAGPRVALTRRLDDGGEPLAPSPLVERLELARVRRASVRSRRAADCTIERAIEADTGGAPLPRAPGLLPDRLSASACEALRTCPYRFFALRLLRLREADELDDEFEKRDYGTWLHAVLHRFHATRATPPERAAETHRLHAIAAEIEAEMGFDAASFLPFQATFARFAPRYVEWLHLAMPHGARWLDGEVALRRAPPAWQGIAMHGIVDRIDSRIAVGRAPSPTDRLQDRQRAGLREKLQRSLRGHPARVLCGVDGGSPTPAADRAPATPPRRKRGDPAVEHAEVEFCAARSSRASQRAALSASGGALPALSEAAPAPLRSAWPLPPRPLAGARGMSTFDGRRPGARR